MELNPNLFKKEVEQVPIREGYGKGLLEAGRLDKRIVALTADLTSSTKTNFFADEFPDRFVQMGIAEQNMASVASGMAAMGKIPFITSYAMFNPGRNWEQIRTTICYNDVPVKIIGSHAGVSVGPDGGTHQAVEDIAITRVIPNMEVIVPCDAIEAKKATILLAKTDKPTYIRLGREKTPVITTAATPFEIGKVQVFFKPESEKAKVGIIATGSLVYNAIMAAKRHDEKGIGISVLNLSTIKPLDEKGILDFVQDLESIVTVEEHQIAGGMGSAVAELLAKSDPKRISFIGVQNRFGQSGEPNEIIEAYGMGIDSIEKAVAELL